MYNRHPPPPLARQLWQTYVVYKTNKPRSLRVDVFSIKTIPDSKIHGAHMGPNWVLEPCDLEMLMKTFTWGLDFAKVHSVLHVIFLILQNYLLGPLSHIHIWLVSLKLWQHLSNIYVIWHTRMILIFQKTNENQQMDSVILMTTTLGPLTLHVNYFALICNMFCHFKIHTVFQKGIARMSDRSDIFYLEICLWPAGIWSKGEK